MKEVQVTVYEAWDGKRFDSPTKARAYETNSLPVRLAGTTAERIQAAIDGTDSNLAEDFERLGKVIRDARKKRGETRWPEARQKAHTATQEATEPVRESAA